MKQKLIRATELAEFVYCAKAWHLKYVEGALKYRRQLANCKLKQMHGISSRVDRLLVGTATDGQVLPPSCWRLFSLSSAGWDGRNDCAADGCYSDGAGAPVLLVKCPVPQENRNSCGRGVLSGSRGTAISSTGPAVSEAGHLRETGLFDPHCRRDCAGRTKEIEAATGQRGSVSQSHDPEPGLLRTCRRAAWGTGSLRPGHLCRAAGSASGIYGLQPQMAHAHDRRSSGGSSSKAGDAQS